MDFNDLCRIDNIDEEEVIEIIRKRYECGYFYVGIMNFMIILKSNTIT